MLKTANKKNKKKKTMKNDILLFAIMFAMAWIGYTVAKDRLSPKSIIAQETIADDATPDAMDSTKTDSSVIASPATATDSASADAADSADQKSAGQEPKTSAGSKPKDVASSPERKSAEPKSAEPKSVEQKIEQVLVAQVESWNRGDLDGFMNAYWNNEALTISGGGNTTLGWEAAYDSYRKKYPPGSMGTINFKDLKTEMASKDSAIVTGRFGHQLGGEKVNGNFSLVMRLVDQQWKIVNDHTSVAKK